MKVAIRHNTDRTESDLKVCARHLSSEGSDAFLSFIRLSHLGVGRLHFWMQALKQGLNTREQNGDCLYVKRAIHKSLCSRLRIIAMGGTERETATLGDPTTSHEFTIAAIPIRSTPTASKWSGTVVAIFDRVTETLFLRTIRHQHLGSDIDADDLWSTMDMAREQLQSVVSSDSTFKVRFPGVKAAISGSVFKEAAHMFSTAADLKMTLNVKARRSRARNIRTECWTIDHYPDPNISSKLITYSPNEMRRELKLLATAVSSELAKAFDPQYRVGVIPLSAPPRVISLDTYRHQNHAKQLIPSQ